MYTVYSEISENPRDFEVMAGAEQYQESGCDVIVAVGGGSPMDCAKAIGIVSTNRRHVLDFVGVDNVEIPGPPLICIPTTAGSSADVSQFAIINNTGSRVKIAIISKSMVPDVALIDPQTTITMDSDLTAHTALDALVHAVEAYVSLASSPITDLHALEAVRLVKEYLPLVVHDLENPRYREKIMLASLQAGLAFSNASLGAVHAMAHSLGGYYDYAHGECNSLLLEHVAAFNYESNPGRYDDISRILAFPDQERVEYGSRNIVRLLRTFRESVGVSGSLRDRGVLADDISVLAGKAHADPCLLTNPRNATLQDLEGIYEEAL